MKSSLGSRLLAEAIGTALLVAAVVGSGIAAERLSPGQPGLELLENSLATALALVAILLALGPVSGAHLNPAVTAVEALSGRLPRGDALPYVLAEVAGGAAGCVLANAMYGLPAVALSTTERFAGALWLSEAAATFGLLLVVRGVAASPAPRAAPFAVAAYVGAGYWFTSSTCFANPAVTLSRALTDSFAGIAPGSVLPFLVAQAAGTALFVLVAAVLFGRAGAAP